MSKYAGMLSALLLTGLLLFLMPGLLARQMADTGRTAPSLRPPQARTMVVWVTSWSPGDRALLSGLCSAYEKQHPGLRIYLRRADAAELRGKDAVLPDAVLYGHGEISDPQGVLLPLAAPAAYPESVVWSGTYQGALYGLPLWYSPNVLCIPEKWLAAEQDGSAGAVQQTQGEAYFGQPLPQQETTPLTAETIPWQRLLESGTVHADSAIGFTQLLHLCPGSLRSSLCALTPVVGQPEAEEAVIRSLQSQLAAKDGRVALCLPAVTGLRVRYVSLCGQSEDAAGFVRFLASAARAVEEAGLLHVIGCTPQAEGLLLQTAALAKNGLVLPNAFSLGAAEAQQICLEDFARGIDPVATLLKLR